MGGEPDGLRFVGTLNLLAYLLVLFALSLPGTPVNAIPSLRTGLVVIGSLRRPRPPGAEPLAEVGRRRAGSWRIALLAWKG